MKLKDARGPRRLLRRSVVAGLLGAALATVGFVGTAGADSPSDDRATFVDGNATTCSDVGLPNDTLLFTNGNANNADANVSGTITNNGTRDVLNVTVLNPAIQVNAVVVKGGNGYNLYGGNFPDMITPNTNGGPPAGFSHWFVCYGPAAPPPPPGPPPGGEGAPGQAGTQVGAAVAVVAQAQFTG